MKYPEEPNPLRHKADFLLPQAKRMQGGGANAK